MFFIDAHNDTIIELYAKNESFLNHSGFINLEKLRQFDSPALFFSIFLRDSQTKDAFSITCDRLSFFKKELVKFVEYISFGESFEDVKNNRLNKKATAFISLEGGEALEGKIENLYHFHKEGVSSITLTWSRRNHLGVGVISNRDYDDYSQFEGHKGLTDFGKEVVREMNRLNMIIDVSHLSDEGFFDVASLSTKPFIASHSNCRTVAGSPRNLTDEQMLAIKKANGIMGITFYNYMINCSNHSVTEDILSHVDYALNLIGDDHIALGSDFDGTTNISEAIKDVLFYKEFYHILEKRYGLDTTNKIFYKNFLRIIENLRKEEK